MKASLFIFFVLLFLLSCNAEKHNLQKNTLKIPLADKNEIKGLSADSIFSAARYIALETNDESLIYTVDKIKIDQNGDFYILDKKMNQLVIFDKNGGYKWRLNRVGQGPEEYLSIKDFILENECIYILSGIDIMVYTKKGIFLEKIKLVEQYCDEFAFTSDYIYLYSDFQSQFLKNIFVMDRNNRSIVASYMNFHLEQRGVGYNSNVLFQTSDCLYSTFPYKYSIYKLETNTYSEILKIDFENNKIYPKELQESSSDKREEYRSKYAPDDWPISNISNVLVTGDIYIFSFIYTSSQYTVLYNMKSKKMIYGYVWMSKKYPIVTPELNFCQNEQIIQIVTPDYLSDLNGDTAIEQNIKKLYTTEESNPIIAIYDLNF